MTMQLPQSLATPSGAETAGDGREVRDVAG